MLMLGKFAIWAGLAALALPCLAQGTGADPVDRAQIVDVDGDGRAEIERLEVLTVQGDAVAATVAIVVESALLARDVSGELRNRLDRLCGDLVAEGRRVMLVRVGLAGGEPHRDGRLVLALRRLFQAWGRDSAPFAGVILVGRFPDAFLVRTVNWRKREPITIGKQAFRERVPFLRRVPEIVAPRCDLVLADLDGDWEARYVESATSLQTLVAVFPDGVPEGGGPATAIKTGAVRLSDFFLVDDGRATVDGENVTIDDLTCDLECSSSDRTRGNPIARPEIGVSRIDARGVAWSPRQEYGGVQLLDDDGAPRRVTLGGGVASPNWRRDLWTVDPALELRLLCEYLDRNHRYRTTPRGAAFKPAAIGHGLPSGFGIVRRGAKEWANFEAAGYDVPRNASLVDLVQWLRRPAVLRTLRAHSNGEFAAFAKTSWTALAAELGGPPRGWNVKGRELVPSLSQAIGGTRAGFFLFRTLWENGALPDHPYLMIHTGCEATAPPGAAKLRYDDPRYGAFPNAESLLFLTPCVALIGRAKVFYDEPRGFCETLRDGGSVGDAWRRYFELESAADSRSQVGGDIGRKRSYFWSVIGDWTLRLHP